MPLWTLCDQLTYWSLVASHCTPLPPKKSCISLTRTDLPPFTTRHKFCSRYHIFATAERSLPRRLDYTLPLILTEMHGNAPAMLHSIGALVTLTPPPPTPSENGREHLPQDVGAAVEARTAHPHQILTWIGRWGEGDLRGIQICGGGERRPQACKGHTTHLPPTYNPTADPTHHTPNHNTTTPPGLAAAGVLSSCLAGDG